MLVVIYWEWGHSNIIPHPRKKKSAVSFSPSNSNIPLPHPHQSQGKPSSYMLSPRGKKKRKKKKNRGEEKKQNKTKNIQKKKKGNTWKKHKVLKMWNLVRFVQVWSQYWPLWGSVCLSIQVIIIIFVEHWIASSSTRAMAWTTAACSTGGKPERKHFYLFIILTFRGNFSRYPLNTQLVSAFECIKES